MIYLSVPQKTDANDDNILIKLCVDNECPVSLCFTICCLDHYEINSHYASVRESETQITCE